MAAVHTTAWAEIGASITAVLGRPGSTSTAAFAESVGATVVSSIAELQPMVDVVDICSPTDTHLDLISAAAGQGLPIVCEKPLARTGTDADHAVAICRDAGVPLLVAHVLRFFPEYARAKQLVADGAIGDVGMMRLNRSAYLPAGGAQWFRDAERSGGVVLDLMIHDVDYAHWVAGPVTKVFAKSGTVGNGADHVLATLRHEGGAITHAQGSWAFPTGTFETSLDIAGSAGVVQPLPGDGFVQNLRVTDSVTDIPQAPTTGESPYTTQVRHFSAVLDGHASLIVDPSDAARAVTVCESILESLTSGRSVEVPT